MSILAAWKVSALTTKVVIVFVGLVVWVWTIEVRDMRRARRGPARRILGGTEIPEWTDEELNEEECL